eukprot:4814040-Amphidinium_carterae.1
MDLQSQQPPAELPQLWVHATMSTFSKTQSDLCRCRESLACEGVYRGLGGYKQYLDPSEGAIAAAKYTGLLGPLRNTLSNVRTTIRVEYWNASSGTDGGICKDYKETGYCGFGDTCKYLHDRSDYKSGFQLDAEWEAKQKAAEEKKRRKWEKRLQKVEEGGDASDSSVERDDDDELPMECPKCSTAWESCSSVPIKTVCGQLPDESSVRHSCDVPACKFYRSLLLRGLCDGELRYKSKVHDMRCADSWDLTFRATGQLSASSL